MKPSGWLILVLLTLFLLPVWTCAQDKAPAEKTAPQESPAMSHEHHAVPPAGEKESAAVHKTMKVDHGKLVEEWKAADARLQAKLAAMNKAKGEQRISAMMAVINELAAQRQDMRERILRLAHGSKECMMMGKDPGKMHSMHPGKKEKPSCCPMMQKNSESGSGAAKTEESQQ